MSLKFFPADLRTLTKSTSFLLNMKWVLCNHTLHLLLIYRLGQSVSCIPFVGRFFGLLIEYFIRIFYASDLSCEAKIGEGLVIVHGHDIVIGSDVVIGRDCTIFNGVTLGNKAVNIRTSSGQPKLGDHVILGTGSKILGPVSIGDNVVVGANAVVINDCPSGVTAVGVPARIIENSNDNHS